MKLFFCFGVNILDKTIKIVFVNMESIYTAHALSFKYNRLIVVKECFYFVLVQEVEARNGCNRK